LQESHNKKQPIVVNKPNTQILPQKREKKPIAMEKNKSNKMLCRSYQTSHEEVQEVRPPTCDK